MTDVSQATSSYYFVMSTVAPGLIDVKNLKGCVFHKQGFLYITALHLSSCKAPSFVARLFVSFGFMECMMCTSKDHFEWVNMVNIFPSTRRVKIEVPPNPPIIGSLLRHALVQSGISALSAITEHYDGLSGFQLPECCVIKPVESPVLRGLKRSGIPPSQMDLAVCRLKTEP
jgi:hypothetical protein